MTRHRRPNEPGNRHRAFISRRADGRPDHRPQPGLTNGERLNHLLAVIAADHSLAVRPLGG